MTATDFSTIASALPHLVATFGPSGALAAIIFYVLRNRDRPADPGKALVEEIRGLREDMQEMRERLVRVETKLEKPTRAR